MTQLNLRDGDAPDIESSKAPSRARQTAIAFLLSLIFPGLGQVYNRQPRKGLAMALGIPLIALISGTRLPLFFWGLMLLLLISIGWRIYIVVDAIRFSWKGRKPEASFKRPGLSVTLVVLIVPFFSILVSTDPFLHSIPVFKAFSVPSDSMCPTICAGERIVVDMNAYKRRSPQHGDLVMLAHGPIENLITKRVIGVEGDLIETDEHGQISVNGAILTAPELCGHPNSQANQNAQTPAFPPTKVPPRTFFVIGDNLSNSYDSRFPEFGSVTPDEIRARPEYIYFSHQFSRIGCKLR